ncbi:MAG: CHAT domain-containing protein [Burkholderiaceae bacterium]
MATSKRQPIIFVVPGHEQSVGVTRAAAELPAAAMRGVLKQSVRVGAQRGAGGHVRVTAVPGEDVVVLHIAGGPALMLHPETARDLMLAQQSEIKRGRGRAGVDAPGPDEVQVPAQLQWRGLEQGAATRGTTRGFLGDVVLSAIDVVAGVAKDPSVDFITSKAVEHVDAQVIAGVYALAPESLPPLKGASAPLVQAPASTDGGPLLVFVHGTFSTTSGSFAKLWSLHPEYVHALFTHYNHRVYGLDHPTLGVSPISNSLTLAQAMPDGARLHLVTHSRGGLVAEVMARVCANPQLSADDLRFFKGDEYASQRDALKALAKVVRRRGIRVDRIVRVACPARGTLLASKRLDAYLSVFKWTLELAGIPVAPVLVDFLAEVAQRRADPQMIPGLAAQIPDSPLVQWLHAVDQPIAGELRVVAGDIEGDSVTSWLKTLLADAFYWTDNDLVVQTRSMYGGPPRASGATFVLDQGGKVSHFNYFSNERTAEAVVDALTQDMPPGFRVIGPLSWSGESATGVRGLGPAAGVSGRDKPAVFILPGILGSNLKVGGKRIWLGWRLINGLKRLDYAAGRADSVEPDGPIGSMYDELADYLGKTHEVIEFAFDWRRPIEEEAARLASAVEAALDARAASGKPVRLLAHSMGGVLARTMQLERPDIWQRMMAHADARLLMLGTPNAGSWAPMQVLSGDDTFGNVLVTFGAPFQDKSARALMARFPGFIQMQAALLDDKLALSKEATWQALADDDLRRVRENSWWHRQEMQIVQYSWGVPPQDVLDRAVALRKRLDAQVDGDLAAFSDKLLLVIGHARFTPDGFSLGDEGLVYLDAPDEGDGRVTVSSARLPGVRTWQLACEHGALPTAKDAFEAYRELLDAGSTRLLESFAEPASVRGAPALTARVRSRPSHHRFAGPPPQSPRELLALECRQPIVSSARSPALPITVVNGDLSFIRQPLLLGHYRSLRLSGTEFVMNRLIGGAMDDSLKVGLYPEPPGTHQIFINTRTDPENPWQPPRPEAVIVAGLGHEGEARPADLVRTVRQATIAWAQRMAEQKVNADADVPALFEIAATMVGSGGTGITVGQSAQLVAQGVREADDRLREANERVSGDRQTDAKRPARGWPRVGHLYLIELYLDRATEAWRALQVQHSATPGRFAVADVVRSGTGALRRPLDSSYRGTDYDFITAVTQEGPYDHATIAYTLDTKRARTEVRAQATQGPLLRELVARASNDQNTDRRIGRTLFQLLIPVEMEPFLGGTTEMVIELDSGTAGIPWELLDTDAGGGGNALPWAIRAKLLRKLRTAQFRQQVMDAEADASVLVIGEPKCDPAIYPRLTGARDEANAVAARLRADGALDAQRVKALISPDDPEQFGADALTVINALLERDWRIVHIAGHGEPPELAGPVPAKLGDPPQQVINPRGVVLSGDAFLGTREIHNMRTVPELVFVNCCHLAARNVSEVLGRPYDRSRFAANVAEELIEIGVRCVIAAGWAVEDEPAKMFATAFYDALLRGRRFVDAVADARGAAHALGGNTWAAYQCYGDPDWIFRRGVGDAQHPTPSLTDEFAGVASAPALALALESLAIRSRYQKASSETQRAKIRHLEDRFSALWGGMGAVAEAFGLAWAETKAMSEAIAWYRIALAANDGSASIKAAEQLGNLRARLALEQVEQVRKQSGRPSAEQLAQARTEIQAALEVLEGLTKLQPSIEREDLCGSAWKRLALVASIAKRPAEERAAIESMKASYARAETLARTSNYAALFYPALNRMAAELIVDGDKPNWKKFDPVTVAEVRESLAIKARDDPDFWSFVGVIELRIYLALAEKRLAGERAMIEQEFEDLFTRVSAASMWSSVIDQTSFVLPKYAQRATGAERQAANQLLARLRGYVRESGGG